MVHKSELFNTSWTMTHGGNGGRVSITSMAMLASKVETCQATTARAVKVL